MPSIWNSLSRSNSRQDVNNLPNIPQPSNTAVNKSQLGKESRVEVVPENNIIVMRTLTGDSQPYNLKGVIILTLLESTNIKDITVQLVGKCKAHFNTGRPHHHYISDTNVLVDLTKSVLQKAGKHSTTLKAGKHTFHFDFELSSELPSTLRLISYQASISYNLKCTVQRASSFQHNLHHKKPLVILHGLPPEALEFSQTCDIENTWPNKLIYAITLPHKVFAAGESIPIAIKFTPIVKGVKVSHLTTIVKEYSVTSAKNETKKDSRMVAIARHHISPDGEPIPVENPLFNTNATLNNSSGARSLPTSPASRPQQSNLEPVQSIELNSNPATPSSSLPNETGSYFPPQRNRFMRRAMVGWSENDPRLAEGPEDLTELNDGEVDSVINIDIPAGTTPSHQCYPIDIQHKIKWSCMITNRDGHQSELRCALPIILIAHELMQENIISTANARRALFGPSAGATNPQTADEAARAAAVSDLPSYTNHIYDRVANADLVTSGTVPSQWSQGQSHYSPLGSPAPLSPVNSRPTTPGIMTNRGSSGVSTPPENLGSGSTPGSPNNQQSLPTRPPFEWMDSELFSSLGMIEQAQRNTGNHFNLNQNNKSPSSSRNQSRAGSRSHSITSSRAPSPDRFQRERRGSEHSLVGAIDLNDDDNQPQQQPPSRSSFSSSHSLNLLGGNQSSASKFNLSKSVPKALRPLTSFRSHSHSASSSKIHSPTTSNLSSPDPNKNKDDDQDDMNALNAVPSYDVASRGFLGGGVVPLRLVIFFKKNIININAVFIARDYQHMMSHKL